jgi:hypothetical protein
MISGDDWNELDGLRFASKEDELKYIKWLSEGDL